MAKKKTKLQPESAPTESTESTEPILDTTSEPEIPKTEIQDPIGDVTEGEATTALEAEPDSKSETEIEAEDSPEPEGESEDDSEPEFTPKPRPPAKLERLQKILAAAGIASRRSAEALIEQGRVQVNGKVVTVLGTKADLGRDHIRVDGKLLQGPERLRYFILNKPRGFVTTVKDPEGRPTVMQFFDKMKERLYPVGRLDYMSEGLLVVTNDGDLANRLTKASSGVEKTYLVKVAGQPTEAELDILRGGVAIERGKPGSSKVRTSPARIRQVRQGDNPWYEVVLIEGRNRELRKMFEEVGHFVEKIRRTGYGPLVLDQEPGNLRELEPRELELLRQAAEGKLRTPKSKDIRRRNLADAGKLPTVLPKPSSRARLAKPLENTQPEEGSAAPSRPSEFRPKKPFATDRPSRPTGTYSKNAVKKPFRPDRGSPDHARPNRSSPDRGGEGFRPSAGRTSAPNPVRSFSHAEDEQPRRAGAGGQANFGSARPSGRSFDRPAYDRPAQDRQAHARPDSAETGRAAPGRPFTAKPKFDKPAWKKPERPDKTGKPAFQRSAPPRREAPKRETRDFDEDLGPVRPPNLHIEEIKADQRGPAQPGPARPYRPRPFEERNFEPRSVAPRSNSPHPFEDRPHTPNRPSRPGGQGRPSFDRPASSPRSSSPKPFRGEGGLARPFTTSSGKPRAGGARPSSKPGKFSKPGFSKSGDRSSAGPAKRPFRRDEGSGTFTPRPAPGSSPSSSRPFTPRTEGASDYRPTKAKPYSSSTSRADRKTGPGRKPGGFSKSGYKGKPTGPKRTGPPSGGKRFGSKPGGKKRG
jgi:23S rRNA pseudouridine2605 synthase